MLRSNIVGVVIAFVILVGGLFYLAHFSIMDESKTMLPDKCSLSSHPHLYCEDWLVQQGKITLALTNYDTDRITIKRIVFKEESEPTKHLCWADNQNLSIPPEETVYFTTDTCQIQDVQPSEGFYEYSVDHVYGLNGKEYEGTGYLKTKVEP